MKYQSKLAILLFAVTVGVAACGGGSGGGGGDSTSNGGSDAASEALQPCVPGSAAPKTVVNAAEGTLVASLLPGAEAAKLPFAG